MTVLHGTTALALSAAICHAAYCLAAAIGQPAMHIPIITALTVVLATLVPRVLAPIVASGEAIAAVLMQVRCCTCLRTVSVPTASMRRVVKIAFLFTHCLQPLAQVCVFDANTLLESVCLMQSTTVFHAEAECTSISLPSAPALPPIEHLSTIDPLLVLLGLQSAACLSRAHNI